MQDQSINDATLSSPELAMRYKLLYKGERQIMAFLILADLCPAEVFVLKKMDHSVGGIMAATCAVISATMMRTLCARSRQCPKLFGGAQRRTRRARERLIDIGRRDAQERVAHLIFEMLVRYSTVGCRRPSCT